MKVSYNWLKDFVDLKDLKPQEVADKLTVSGLEVEEVLFMNEHLHENIQKQIGFKFVMLMLVSNKFKSSHRQQTCLKARLFQWLWMGLTLQMALKSNRQILGV